MLSHHKVQDKISVKSWLTRVIATESTTKNYEMTLIFLYILKKK